MSHIGIGTVAPAHRGPRGERVGRRDENVSDTVRRPSRRQFAILLQCLRGRGGWHDI